MILITNRQAVLHPSRYAKSQKWLKNMGAASFLTLSSISMGAGCCVLGAMLAPMPAQAAVVATNFADLVEQVAPGVVRVNVVKEVSQEELAKAQTAELLRQFFGNRVNIPESQTNPTIEYAYGTAFFVTPDGYLLTNHHVVAGADKITVSLSDRTELDAKLVSSDERSDVAVLKVEATPGKPFPALPIGDSNLVRVGEPVLAIGSPFGFDYSASAGIVSAKTRNFSRNTSVPFIQTDVALNPGNSGGPLFNQRGEVIGINSRIFSGTGGYMGLSFSIPINAAMDIYEQLKSTGEVMRPYFGVFPQDIDRNLAEAYGLDKPQGALLIKISPDSPAEMAGLKPGDIITQYNGQAVLESADLTNQINRAKPGDAFTATVLRDGKLLHVSGKLVSQPTDVTSDISDKNNSQIKLGLRIREIPKSEAAKLGATGVVITAVDPTGLAARSGLQAGDIITNLHQIAITNVGDFKKAIEQLPATGVVTIEVVRQGVPAIIGLRME